MEITILGEPRFISPVRRTVSDTLRIPELIFIDPDKPAFATRITNAFRFGWNWIGELSVAMVSIWPLLLAVLGIILFYKRANKSKPKQA